MKTCKFVFMMVLFLYGVSYSQSTDTEAILGFIHENINDRDLSERVKVFAERREKKSVSSVRDNLEMYIESMKIQNDFNVLEIKNVCIAYNHLVQQTDQDEFIQFLHDKLINLNQRVDKRKNNGILDIGEETDLLLNFSTTYHLLEERMLMLYQNESYDEAIGLIDNSIKSSFVYIRSLGTSYLRKIMSSVEYHNQRSKVMVDELKNLKIQEEDNLDIEYIDAIYAAFRSKSILKDIDAVLACIEN